MEDPFATFDLPRTFAIDLELLRQRYLELITKYHPDRFLDPVDQAEAQDRLAAINQAYLQLLDPERRAHILMRLFTNDRPEYDDSSLPPQLLDEMLEIQERIQTAKSCGDQTILQQIHEQAQQELDIRHQLIAQLFNNLASKSVTESSSILRQIRMQLNALRYYQRLVDQTHSDPIQE